MIIKSELPNSIIQKNVENDILLDIQSRTPIAILEISDETILDLNNAALNLLGAKEPDEITGKPVSYFVHPKYYIEVRRYLENLKEGTHLQEARFKIIRLNEQRRDVELLAVNVHVNADKLSYTIFLHDITYRVRHDFFDSTLNQIEQDIHSSINNYEISAKAMKMAAIATGCDSAAVAFLKEDKWEVVHTFKFIPDIKGMVYTSEDLPHAKIAVQQKKIQLIGDTTTDPRINNERLVNLGIMAVVVVPLYTKHREIGAIFFNYYQQRVFEKEKEVFLSRLSTSLSLALENTDLFDHLNRELTERDKNEKRLIKLNHILLALSRSSQAMLSAKSENQFIEEICSIIIDETNNALVWVGFLENRNIVIPVWKGEAADYYKSLDLKIRDDSPHSRGPAVMTILMKEPVVSDINDPVFLPWRENALRYGIASSLCLPLIQEGEVYGLLTIYSREFGAFTPDEVMFLSEIAKYLSQGILSIRLGTAKQKAEEKLKLYAKELKDLNATKDKFFSIISHDLRNPFTSLIGASELLVEEIKESGYEGLNTLATIVNESANNGFRLLQNLLDWSRSQTGTIAFKPVDVELNIFIMKVIESIRPSAINKEQNIHFHPEGEIRLKADVNMLNTVLRNLISNAIKFTQKGGDIDITTDLKGNYAKIKVQDNGIGISDEDAAKLFRLDEQVTKTGTNNERGSGLGLLLCKEFVERHGGKIWVESTKGEGSGFFFTLPVDEVKR